MRTELHLVLLLSAAIVPGCGNREATRYNPANPLRFRQPRRWEKERAEFLALNKAREERRERPEPTPGTDTREAIPTRGGYGTGRLNLSLDEAVEYALRHNPQTVSAKLEKDKARGRIISARSAALPTLSLSGSYLRMGEVPSFDVPGMGTITVGAADNYKAAFTLSQPLYTGGKVRSAIGIAKKYEQSASSSYEAAAQAVRFQATQTYYGLVMAGIRLEMLEEQRRLARSHLQDTETKYHEGAALKLHVMRARSALSLAESALIQARNERDTARREFLLTIGAPVSRDIALKDGLPDLPGETPNPPGLAELSESRPDLHTLKSRIDMQELNLKIVSGDRKPIVSAFGEAGWEKPSSKTMGSLEWDDYWQAGVSVSWNLFDGGNVSGRLLEERAALKQMEDGLGAALRSARKEVLDAAAQIRASRLLLEARRNALAETDEALRLAQAGFEEGTVSQVELLDAQTALTSARVGCAEARYALTLAWAAYDMATGTEIPHETFPERSE